MLGLARACIITLLLMSGTSPLWAQRQHTTVVELMAMHGIKLKATYFDSGRPGPAIMHLRMCGDVTRKTWEDLGPKLAPAVFTCWCRTFGATARARLMKNERRQDPIWAQLAAGRHRGGLNPNRDRSQLLRLCESGR